MEQSPTDSMDEVNNGTRSFKTEVVGSDSFSLTLNFKFLIQMFMVFGSLIFGYVSLQERLTNLERNLEDTTEQLQELVEKHIIEDEKKFADLEKQNEELSKWYEREMNLNPLSWRKKKSKK